MRDCITEADERFDSSAGVLRRMSSLGRQFPLAPNSTTAEPPIFEQGFFLATPERLIFRIRLMDRAVAKKLVIHHQP
jgi:hypothetical protein